MTTHSYIWQDREIRFDTNVKHLKTRRGEFEIDSINSVEDTKGNNTGIRGSLIVTNLRILWISHKNNKINLSIGYNCLTTLSIKNASSKLRGNTQALYMMTKFGKSRYEFIFTSLVKASPRLFITVQAVYRAYCTSRLYRDLKLRGALVREKKLQLLPQEKIFKQIDGVWNLSADQGNLGIFHITNVRIVWYARLAENFNVSIPYIQMRSIRISESKFGPALVISTDAKAGGYTLGFRVDPPERMHEVLAELHRIHEAYTNTPFFGVEFAVEEKSQTLESLKVQRQHDDVEIVDEDVMFSGTNYQAYLDSSETKDNEPVFNKELGLSMEPVPQGITVEKLWFGN